ncbi:sigma-70 family RNA polymerase sigma factor [uncultured Oscillibacter sp.]|uniref:RNA polymerase sigma factor n=1 Tax=uncultured Oscillibacter sp. TaxID=876091 RepID=UPI002623F2BB|nr:sigma-70 family RNA polymerase sigma factor [uncultured Oscillibacter sp.]
MDKARFTAAVERYQNMVYRTALHALGSPQDADDAVQEVFLRLFRRGDGFDGEEHLRRWLLRVTVNCCRDTLKSPWRKRRTSWEEIPEIPVFDRPEQAALYREVMALPEKYRTVLNLFYYEEFTAREIGELLGVDTSTVTTRLARARRRLRERLGEDWQDE